jgi:hypothetical protein
MRSRGHVKGVELAPALGCMLADNAGECRNNMLQPGNDSLRDPVPGGLAPGQESECGTGLLRGAGSPFEQSSRDTSAEITGSSRKDNGLAIHECDIRERTSPM